MSDSPIQLDLRGYQCPMPVLKTRHHLKKLQSGQALLVITDDPLAGLDIPHFCQETGQTLVEKTVGEGDEMRFHIRRTDQKI